jgi:suppressor for copper-sensitivity B
MIRAMPLRITNRPCSTGFQPVPSTLARVENPCYRVLLIFAVILFPSSGFGQATRASVSAALNITALKPGTDAKLAIVLDVKEGYHAQSHTPLTENLIPCRVILDDNPSLDTSDPIYPAGKIEQYGQLGKMSVYTGRNIIYVPVHVKSDAALGAVTISGTLRYQICDDKQCYKPEKTKFTIDTKIVGANESIAPANAELFPSSLAPTTEESMPFLRVLGMAFLAGLIFNIMPCVLPVLPLKAVGFYEVSQHHRSKSIALGFVFSVGLISVFAILAVFVLVLKQITWGEMFAKGWFIWSMVALLIALAMGLFGGWNLRLPMGFYTLEPRHDTYGGNFFWGALTAILATPCTAPLLPVVLAWAATQPAYLGVPAMLMVGVGMASPYLILSAAPELARRFPRSGPWPDLFKQMMGFLLLASAAYFGGGRLVHSTNFWWIVTAVVAVASLYLVARSVQLTKNALPVAICAILAVAMLGGTLFWTTRMTGILAPAGSANVEAAWVPYSDDQFRTARESGNIVLVKFTANWCFTCQGIEATVYRDPDVWDYLKKNGVIAMKADFSEENPPAERLLKTLNPSGGIPLTAIYAPGAEKPIQLQSVYSSDTLLSTLRQLPQKSVADTR